tara:strand:+ start:1212 stop:1349 length:138 start_codon:yes stop_codon:yes gene_type:complete
MEVYNYVGYGRKHISNENLTELVQILELGVALWWLIAKRLTARWS